MRILHDPELHGIEWCYSEGALRWRYPPGSNNWHRYRPVPELPATFEREVLWALLRA